MKLVVFFSVLAFAAACVLACDRNSNNKPVCNKDNLNQPIRNFWDPSLYWICKSEGAKAESLSCPLTEAFDVITGKCIDWGVWKFTPFCPPGKQ